MTMASRDNSGGAGIHAEWTAATSGDPRCGGLARGGVVSDDVAAGAATTIAGRYRLRAMLGSGGQGKVWEAEDLLTSQFVALKVFSRGFGVAPARARREIATLRLLRLPGVVALLDEGIHDGQAFLVMERVTGAPFPGTATPCAWSSIENIAVRLLETLEPIHGAGVIHRDLKPENVLVDPSGEQLTILDFGLSCTDSNIDERLTGTGEMLGTVTHLAPEQIEGNRITARTDLFAVGALLYQALTGHVPHHQEKTVHAMLMARVKRPATPIAELAPDVPRAVARWIERLLAPDPGDRPRSAREALAMLRGAAPVLAAPLPRLGTSHIVSRLCERVSAGESIDLIGAPGSGRSRCLSDLAERLAAEGRAVRWTVPGRAAFASLHAVIGPLDEFDHRRLQEVEREVERRLAEVLDARKTVVLVDDGDRIDRASAVVIERCRRRGAVVRVVDRTDLGDAPDVIRFEALDEAALADLFVGPDRLLHIREDAARALWVRTQGLPGLVAAEVSAWVRAGLARWNGDRLAMDRYAIDRLETGLAIPLASDDAAPFDRETSTSADEVLAWSAVAWPNADAALLSTVLGRPRWIIEAELTELAAHGRGQMMADGRFRARSIATESWSLDRRVSAHRAVADALPAASPGRLFHLVAGCDEGDRDTLLAIAHEASARARVLAKEGRLGHANAVLAEGLRAVRRISPPPEVEIVDLLSQWVVLAVVERRPQSLDRVLYEITRTPPKTAATEQLERLVRAALATPVWTERALSEVEAIPPFYDPELERVRRSVYVLAAHRSTLATEERVIASIAPWAEGHHDPYVRAAYDGWLGQLRYRQGRYAESAELHARSAEVEWWVSLRASALLHAASAAMEGFDIENAERWGRDALALSRECRHVFHEARAEWLLRCIRYRLDEARAPDLELVRAIAEVGAPELEPLVYLNESAVAWRAGSRDVALDLATRARAAWAKLQEPLGALLSRALCIAFGDPTDARRIPDLTGRAVECRAPGVGLQALALLAMGGGDIPRKEATLTRLAGEVPHEHWKSRLDVLSVDEALRALHVDPETFRPPKESGIQATKGRRRDTPARRRATRR